VGAELDQGGDVTNNSGGTISGTSYGLFVTGNSATVTNFGTISGGIYAVDLAHGSATNRVVDGAGSTFSGLVSGGGGTLELTSGAGSITGLNSGSFDNFQNLSIDSGGDWHLNGSSNSVATVTNNGILNVTGSLDVSSAIDPDSTGQFLIDNGALEVAAALGDQTQMSFNGSVGSSDLLTIDNASTFGARVGTASYTGPELENFGASDMIDFHNFNVMNPLNLLSSYDSSSGLLQISNSSTGQAATLDFQNKTLGAGSFQVASDNAGGILVTHHS
jgi:hypothetical protein